MAVRALERIEDPHEMIAGIKSRYVDRKRSSGGRIADGLSFRRLPISGLIDRKVQSQHKVPESCAEAIR